MRVLILLLLWLPVEATLYLEPRASYFIPQSKRFRHIYQEGGGCYGFMLTKMVSPHFGVSLAGDYFEKKGRALGAQRSTRLKWFPFMAGLRVEARPFEELTLYTVIGSGLNTIHIDNELSCQTAEVFRKTQFGYFGQLGTLLEKEGYFLDLFLEYHFNQFHTKTDSFSVMGRRVDASGFKLGLGLGAKFP